ncbi:MAG: alkaline phosphatase D family protein [Bacteroidia bacterium]
MKFHLLLPLLLIGCTAAAQTTYPPNIFADTAQAPFLWGVGSFDPTADHVILWTKVDPQGGSSPITLHWETFGDAALTQPIGNGTAMASSTTNWTAKYDVSYPAAGTYYWYRWHDGNGHYSAVGRTKTAPTGMVPQLRMAVMSCSSIFSGYFNAYRRIGERNDLDLVIHLGDYIYDFVDQDEQVRVPVPAPIDPQTLAEWRDRQDYYLLDPDLRLARQNHPWTVIWDNHDVDGDSPQHMADAIQAFQEYVPMRLQNSGQPDKIYRSLSYGELVDLHLTDVETQRDMDTLPNGDWSIMGNAQWDWLSQSISASNARWHLIGNEKMFTQFSTAGLGSLISFGDGPVADSSAWDGYNADRVRLLDYLDQNGIDNTIILSGDIHMSFICDAPSDYNNYDPGTGSGSKAMEFLPTSISRGNFDEAGITGFLAQLVQVAIETANPHHVHSELTSHGYGILDIRPDTATAEFWYSPILQISTSESFSTGYYAVTGENHWRRSAISSPTGLITALPAPDEVLPMRVEVFPNPVRDYATLRWTEPRGKSAKISILESSTGRVVATPGEIGHTFSNHAERRLDLRDLPSGHYQILLESSSQSLRIPFVRSR